MIMYVFIFVSSFMINFSLYQAGLQNYANQGFEEKGPPFPGKIDENVPTNGNRNGYAGKSIYTRYFDGEKEVLSVGNGNNKKNVFYIGESPPDNSRTYSQGVPDLGNRFGSDAPQGFDRSLPRTHNTQNTREITRINSFGNGGSNHNTFFINDLDGDDTTVTVYSSSDNNNKRRTNIQKPDYRLNTNYDNTNTRRNFNEGPTHTYNSFGRGPDNTNFVIINGKPIRTDFDTSVNNYDNINTRRNFNDGGNWAPTNSYTFNKIGNGIGNTNLFVTNNKPTPSYSDPSVGYHDNINQRRYLNQESNFNNKRTAYTYNKIGYGPYNKNVFINNDKFYSPDSGQIVTFRERQEHGDSTTCHLKGTCRKPLLEFHYFDLFHKFIKKLINNYF